MGALKLKKHGNSYGFTIPSQVLKEVHFKSGDEFEMILGENSLTFVKRRPHNSKWSFKKTSTSKEDKEWVKADLGDWDE